ncbi:MAG: tetratricopeptide repeat protein [Nitrospirae bacterium]|nr:tetratricopeptide repeat protein [Nitrospirota bacterium]
MTKTIHYSPRPRSAKRGGLFTICCVLLVACVTTSDIEDVRNAEVHYKLGISYLAEQRLNDAFIEFQKAIKLDPEDKNSMNALGLVSTEFEKYDEAISYYKRAIAIDPNYSEAMNNLGITYTKMENWDEAINYFRMALENPIYITPDVAYSNMGYAFYKIGDYINARNAIKNALLRGPDNPQAIYILGLVHVKLGKDDAAIEEFKKVIAIAPDYIEAHWELANAYHRVGNKEKAVEYFRVVFGKSKDDKKRKEALQYIEILR